MQSLSLKHFLLPSSFLLLGFKRAKRRVQLQGKAMSAVKNDETRANLHITDTMHVSLSVLHLILHASDNNIVHHCILTKPLHISSSEHKAVHAFSHAFAFNLYFQLKHSEHENKTSVFYQELSRRCRYVLHILHHRQHQREACDRSATEPPNRTMAGIYLEQRLGDVSSVRFIPPSD